MQNCVICENTTEKQVAGAYYKFRTDSKLRGMVVTVFEAFKECCGSAYESRKSSRRSLTITPHNTR